MRERNAFMLLALIAYRARRTNNFSVHSLETGEALIGDADACGLTQREYRTAKEKLNKWNLAAFRPTNRGTVAKIITTGIFDINIDGSDWQKDNPETNSRQARDKQTTTNKNDKKGKNGKNKNEKRKFLDHIYLTEKEYALLLEKFGEHATAEMIARMNCYAHQIGARKFKAKYDSHYHTLLNWERMNKDKGSFSHSTGNSKDNLEGLRDFVTNSREKGLM